MDASWSPKPDAARPRSLTAAVYEWVDERLGLEEILALARKKTVPDHKHSFWHYWGGISLFFFFSVQVFSGVLLLVYYRPGAEAYESVRQIAYDIRFGWLIRSARSWSANLMAFAVFVHRLSVHCMFSVLHEGVPQAARVWLVERDDAAGADAVVRLQRLPVADGRSGLFRHEGRAGDSSGAPDCRRADERHCARRP
ncbi:MAG: hypothetical protein CFK52_12625 [Chloracidobacterium sp. CP2_5A]|nr:MAG: hypothetical protein CFK52_12625 [Chloracidobacterium sp. CP2_5A]